MTEPAMVSDGFVPLQRADDAPGAQVGCLFGLSTFLLVLGGGIIAVFIFYPGGTGDMWVMPVVGGAFGLVGLVLLYAGVRGARGLKFAPTEVSIERGIALRPGATLRVRLRQPGEIGIESLKLKARCERVYRRKVKNDSSATVQDRDLLWEQVLLDIRNERIAAGDVLERVATLVLPADVPPTGPAQPDGRIHWQLEVWGEAGWLRATHHAFRIWVRGAAASADAPAQPPVDLAMPERAPRRDPGDTSTTGSSSRPDDPMSWLSGNGGCLLFGLGFLFGGVFFLWMFFSGAAFSGKGNPYMALFGGALFSIIGLAALAALVMSVLPARSSARRQRRLP
jgi:hypothetical protein